MARSITVNLSSPDIINMTGKWTFNKYLKVSYSWSNAPSGMKSTVPIDSNKYKSGDLVSVDGTMTATTAYKDESAKKYYKFSGWNKSGSFNISSDINISGSWDNGKSVGFDPTIHYKVADINKYSFARSPIEMIYNDYDGYYYFLIGNKSSQSVIARSNDLTNFSTVYTNTYSDGQHSSSYLVYIKETHRMFCSGYGPFILWSDNGTTWTEATYSTSSITSGYPYVYDIYYNNGTYYVGYINTYSSSSVSYTILTSSDGKVWNYNNNWQFGQRSQVPVGVMHFGDYFFYNTGYNFKRSTDGVNWELCNYTPNSNDTISLTYNPNTKTIVIASNSNGQTYWIYKSTDWLDSATSVKDLLSFYNNSLYWACICYGNGYYIAASSNNTFIYSTDLVNWTKFTVNSNISNSGLQPYAYYLNEKFIYLIGDTNLNADFAYIDNPGYPENFKYVN